jgi:hypothetical protein
MQVNSWVKGRRPIPPVKHYALAIFLLLMIGMIGEAPDGHHKARAKLLEDAVITLVQLALDKALPKIPNHVVDAGMALADQMLARLEAH